MATTPLTSAEATASVPAVDHEDRFAISVSEEVYAQRRAKLSMDPSMEATLARLEKLEAEHGPLRMGSDFADDLEAVIAMRRPSDTSRWD